MDEDESDLYNKICRLCGNEREFNINLFSEDGKILDLISKIMFYLRLNVLPHDDLPQLVCYQCVYKIVSFHNFKEMCTETELTLKKSYSKTYKLQKEVDCLPLSCSSITADSKESLQKGPIDIHETAKLLRRMLKVEVIDTTIVLTVDSMAMQELEESQGLSTQYAVESAAGTLNYAIKNHCERTLTKDNFFDCKIGENIEINNVSYVDSENNDSLMEVTDIKIEITSNETSVIIDDPLTQVVHHSEGTIRDSDPNVQDSSSVLDVRNKVKQEEDCMDSCYESEVNISEKRNESELCFAVDDVGFEREHSCSPDFVEVKPDVQLLEHMHTEIRITDSNGKARFMCPVCKKDFSTKHYVQDHMKIHSGERPSKCSVCSRAYRNSSMLREHMKIHAETRDHKCSVCGKTFVLHHGLLSHLRIHSDARRLVCAVCGTGFKHKSVLRRHMRVHTGEKPYICKVCGRTYADHSARNRHMRTHTGERPFGCAHCGKTFQQRLYLSVHLKSHTDERPFSCPICTHKFRSKAHLKKHLACIHKKNITKIEINPLII